MARKPTKQELITALFNNGTHDKIAQETVADYILSLVNGGGNVTASPSDRALNIFLPENPLADNAFSIPIFRGAPGDLSSGNNLHADVGNSIRGVIDSAEGFVIDGATIGQNYSASEIALIENIASNPSSNVDLNCNYIISQALLVLANVGNDLPVTLTSDPAIPRSSPIVLPAGYSDPSSAFNGKVLANTVTVHLQKGYSHTINFRSGSTGTPITVNGNSVLGAHQMNVSATSTAIDAFFTLQSLNNVDYIVKESFNCTIAFV
jgi:hypothetical protein